MPEAEYNWYEIAIGFKRCVELVMFTDTARGLPTGTLEGAEMAMVIPAVSCDGCEVDVDGFVFGSREGGGAVGTREAGTVVVLEAVCDEEYDVGV
jgi:hypothetical protein